MSQPPEENPHPPEEHPGAEAGYGQPPARGSARPPDPYAPPAGAPGPEGQGYVPPPEAGYYGGPPAPPGGPTGYGEGPAGYGEGPAGYGDGAQPEAGAGAAPPGEGAGGPTGRGGGRPWLALVLVAATAAVLVLGGGAVTAWLVLRDPDQNGAAEPGAAVESFLEAVYRDQDAAAAADLVCSEARDEEALAARIQQIQGYEDDYPHPRFRWTEPEVTAQDGAVAVVTVTLTLTTADEQVSEQQLEAQVLDKDSDGWWVCDMATVDPAQDDGDDGDGGTDDGENGDGENGGDGDDGDSEDSDGSDGSDDGGDAALGAAGGGTTG